MENIKLKAYAKINLHLDVLGIAENGYHKVDTVMQTVSLWDDVEISFCDGEKHSIECDHPSVPNNEKNLAWRAADLFLERIGKKGSVNIKIVKRIPVAAGLAGGSTDAAAVFRGMNILYGEPLSMEELCETGAALGADVPFCIAGGTKFADRYGDILHPFPKMPECCLVVACGKEGVSTPWAYKTLDTVYSGFTPESYTPKGIDGLREAIEKGSVREMAECMYNVFERAIEPEREEVTRIKRIMESCGVFRAMMSGSGPSVVGVFPDEIHAREAENTLIAEGFDAAFCKPIEE